MFKCWCENVCKYLCIRQLCEVGRGKITSPPKTPFWYTSEKSNINITYWTFYTPLLPPHLGLYLFYPNYLGISFTPTLHFKVHFTLNMTNIYDVPLHPILPIPHHNRWDGKTIIIQQLNPLRYEQYTWLLYRTWETFKTQEILEDVLWVVYNQL